jgi:N6-adenosine-specific RNA methylase IME4
MSKSNSGKYQVMGRLRPEEYDALESDIKTRGILVPVEVDEDGEVLDGYTRREIAEKHGLTYKTIVRKGWTEDQKKDHAFKLNLARRHLDPLRWGLAFKQLLELRGVKRKPGAPCKGDNVSTLDTLYNELGVSKGTARKRLAQADTYEVLPAKQRAAVDSGKVTLATAKRETCKEAKRKELEAVETKEVKAAAGVYDVLAIDPPWPIEKIEREVRPNQTAELDYPTMSLADIQALVLPMADECHVWLWTTQRFLPEAFNIITGWGLRYICTFVWHKAGGFQPVGLPQYNCEFAVYARHGSPAFLDTKALPTCFEAKRGKHSEKPEEFYALLRRVTAGRRLDMFNRRRIEGFDSWGKEASK